MCIKLNLLGKLLKKKKKKKKETGESATTNYISPRSFVT